MFVLSVSRYHCPVSPPQGWMWAPELSPVCGTMVAQDAGAGCGAWSGWVWAGFRLDSGWIRAGFVAAACTAHEGLHFVCQALTCESKWRAARLSSPTAKHSPVSPAILVPPQWTQTHSETQEDILSLYTHHLLKGVDPFSINTHPAHPSAVPVSRPGQTPESFLLPTGLSTHQCH